MIRVASFVGLLALLVAGWTMAVVGRMPPPAQVAPLPTTQPPKPSRGAACSPVVPCCQAALALLAGPPCRVGCPGPVPKKTLYVAPDLTDVATPYPSGVVILVLIINEKGVPLNALSGKLGGSPRTYSADPGLLCAVSPLARVNQVRISALCRHCVLMSLSDSASQLRHPSAGGFVLNGGLLHYGAHERVFVCVQERVHSLAPLASERLNLRTEPPVCGNPISVPLACVVPPLHSLVPVAPKPGRLYCMSKFVCRDSEKRVVREQATDWQPEDDLSP